VRKFISPSSILVLPRLEFDDEGNIRGLATVSYNVDCKVIAESELSDKFEIIGGEEFKLIIERVIRKLNLKNATIRISFEKRFSSLNQELSALLSSFASYLSLFDFDLNDHIKNLEEEVLNEKICFLSPMTLLYKGCVFFKKDNFSSMCYELNFDLLNYSIILIELGSLDFNYFLKDKNYRKVLAIHSSSSFDFFSYSMDLPSLYEANNRLAFQAGIIEPEIEEMMNEARKLNCDFVGYNYFSRAFHCLVKKELRNTVYENLIGILSKNDKITILEFFNS
jgi:hypothetical protein